MFKVEYPLCIHDPYHSHSINNMYSIWTCIINMLVGKVVSIMHMVSISSTLILSTDAQSMSLHDIHLHIEKNIANDTHMLIWLMRKYLKHQPYKRWQVVNTMSHSNYAHTSYCYWKSELKDKHTIIYEEYTIRQTNRNEEHQLIVKLCIYLNHLTPIMSLETT